MVTLGIHQEQSSLSSTTNSRITNKLKKKETRLGDAK
jgi:hypothetical protein